MFHIDNETLMRSTERMLRINALGEEKATEYYSAIEFVIYGKKCSYEARRQLLRFSYFHKYFV